MAATVTLSTTTLSESVSASDGLFKVGSTSGLAVGTRLFLDKELVSVVSLGIAPWVNVRRGVDGTPSVPHISGATIYIGRAHDFYDHDPVGAPEAAIAVSPHINVLTGSVWFAQGSPDPARESQRWWQLQTTTYSTGPLGVAVQTPSPTSST
jgi:hypothetical protein